MFKLKMTLVSAALDNSSVIVVRNSKDIGVDIYEKWNVNHST